MNDMTRTLRDLDDPAIAPERAKKLRRTLLAQLEAIRDYPVQTHGMSIGLGGGMIAEDPRAIHQLCEQFGV